MHEQVRLRWVAGLAYQVVAAIHLVLAKDHVEEKLYVGMLFLLGSAALMLAALALTWGQPRVLASAWLVGTGVCLAMFVGFVLSRTTGLPGDYHEELSAGYENVLGYVSLAFEAVAAYAAVAAGWSRERLRRPPTAQRPRAVAGGGRAGPTG